MTREFEMKIHDLAVLSDGFFIDEARRLWDSTLLPVAVMGDDPAEGADVLERLFDDGKKGFVVHGGDDLIGRVVTAYWRRKSLGAKPLRLWPMDVGRGYVAAACGATDGPKRAVRQAEREVEDWRQCRLGTIKITASTESAAWYGFSFGAGWIFRALKARDKARGGASDLVQALGRLASDTWRDDDGGPVAMRVAVDHTPGDGAGGSIVVSTLEKSYFGLGVAGEGPILWDGLSAAQLMRRAVTPDLLGGAASSGRAFESVHLDSPDGWVLDGALHESKRPEVVQVMAGPSVEFVVPARGPAAKVRRWLGG